MANEKLVFLAAERQQESGGDYGIVNNSSGALGAWQVMPANLPSWEAECGMPYAGPGYYLSHPLYQNRLVYCILGRYYDRYGPRGAAAMWYSGQPDWHATYGNPPVYQYVNDVIALMGRGGFTINTGGARGTITFSTPPANEGDWSKWVGASARNHISAAGIITDYARAMARLR